MTYRQLFDELKTFDDARLDDTVTIYNPDQDEMYSTLGIGVAAEDDTDLLDEGHIYIILSV